MKKILFISVLIFLCGICSTTYAEISLSVCGFAMDKSDYVEVASVDLVKGKIILKTEDTGNFRISLDMGKTWQSMLYGEYSFVPEDMNEYPVLLAQFDMSGNINDSKMAVIKYFDVNIRDVFEEFFREISMFYMSKQEKPFFDFFDEAEYNNYDTFVDNLKETFEDNNNLNLDIRVQSYTVQDELAIVRVDWDKRFAFSDSQTGKNNEIHLVRYDNKWKIKYIEDDSIFVVGTGLLVFSNK
ncbi:MAG: hypothetical protein PHP69_06845 [Candidatus Omnitrophica bacterium]|jgi:hypothetical protein|nr:hypothetical protein [Candidatus Omnitrophota bacterium]